MNLKVRQAVMEDYFQLTGLSKEVLDLHIKNRPDVYVNGSNPLPKDQFNNMLNDQDVRLFVVQNTDTNELAAYGILKIMNTRSIQVFVPTKYAYIEEFGVKLNYRRNGIGKMLFQYILDYSKEEGALSLQLVVWEFNKEAIEFYEAMGMSTKNRRMEIDLY